MQERYLKGRNPDIFHCGDSALLPTDSPTNQAANFAPFEKLAVGFVRNCHYPTENEISGKQDSGPRKVFRSKFDECAMPAGNAPVFHGREK